MALPSYGKGGGLVFSAVGTIFLLFGLYFLFDAIRFSGVAEQTVGEVLAVETHHSRDSDGRRTVTYQPTIRYQSVDGKTYDAKTHISASSYDYSVGARIQILFDPANPQEVRIDGHHTLYLFPGIFILVGLISVAIGLRSAASRRKTMPQMSPPTAEPEFRTVRRARDD